MSIKNLEIKPSEAKAVEVASLPTRPTSSATYGGRGLTAQQMKEAYDAYPALVKERFNALIADLLSGSALEDIPFTIPTHDPFGTGIESTVKAYLEYIGKILDFANDSTDDSYKTVYEFVHTVIADMAFATTLEYSKETRILKLTIGGFEKEVTIEVDKEALFVFADDEQNNDYDVSKPDSDYYAINVKYARDKLVAKIEPISQTTTAYVVLGDSTPSGIRVDGIAQPNSLVLRSTGGVVRVGTPVGDSDSVNLGYANKNYLSLTGGTITGSLTIAQDLIVQGKTTSKDVENLTVKDNLLTLAKDNTAALTSPAGITVPKYNGTESGALVFDNTGTAYVGDVTLTEDGNIDVANSDLQPLATRGTLVNGNLVKWDADSLTLVDSGKKADDFVLKRTTTDNASYLYAYDKNGDRPFQLTGAANANSVAYRGTGGRLKVGNAVEDADAMPKKQAEDTFVSKFDFGDSPKDMVYCTESADGTTIGIPYDQGSNPFTIAQRGATGSLTVGTPGSDESQSAVNIEYANANYKAYVHHLHITDGTSSILFQWINNSITSFDTISQLKAEIDSTVGSAFPVSVTGYNATTQKMIYGIQTTASGISTLEAQGATMSLGDDWYVIDEVV